MIKRIAIFGSDNGRSTVTYVRQIVDFMRANNITVSIDSRLIGKLSEPAMNDVTPFNRLLVTNSKPDMVFSVGGDGTFLETIMHIGDSGIPVAGVNAGRLGFLANIHDDLEGSLKMIIGGKYSIIERSLLELAEPYGIFAGSNFALNDITIQKADLNMIRIKVFSDNIHLNTYWADGLIISTATGSTAYNLSAGGPILSPGDTSIIISPISPHNLTVRPIVIPGNSRLKFSVEGRSSEYLVTCDFRSVRVSFLQDLVITQPAYRIRTVNVDGQDFFRTLRDKLMWGADPRN
jgi:NAD+ kinase